MSYDIAHKSCIFDGKCFSNTKFTYASNGIDYLKQKCVIIDKISENINIPLRDTLVNEPIKFPYINVIGIGCKSGFAIYLFDDSNGFMSYKKFYDYKCFYDYICLNYPHLIKIHDIKIALKD